MTGTVELIKGCDNDCYVVFKDSRERTKQKVLLTRMPKPAQEAVLKAINVPTPKIVVWWAKQAKVKFTVTEEMKAKHQKFKAKIVVVNANFVVRHCVDFLKAEWHLARDVQKHMLQIIPESWEWSGVRWEAPWVKI